MVVEATSLIMMVHIEMILLTMVVFIERDHSRTMLVIIKTTSVQRKSTRSQSMMTWINHTSQKDLSIKTNTNHRQDNVNKANGLNQAMGIFVNGKTQEINMIHLRDSIQEIV